MTRILTLLNAITCVCRHTTWRTGLIMLFLFGAATGFSQPGTSIGPSASKYSTADTSYEEGDPEDAYEEMSITLNVPRIGSAEIPAIIYGTQVYLSVKDLFDFLKIRNTVSPDFDLVEGFFIYPKDTYFIDKTNNRIVFGPRSYALNPRDIIRTESNLYLKSNHFGEVFGLQCAFNFRSLSVTLTTTIELPAIREMHQELMRRNISRLKGDRKADTNIHQSYPLFHFGMADWSVSSAQTTGGINNTRANLGLGAVVAGGETNLSLNYNSDEKLNLRQQFYQWKVVNNNHSALRQITAGKIFAQSTSSIFAPVIGIQVTNTPTTYRRSFGTYTLSNTTEPGWTVELYINNILVNYVKADASGFYTFEVPMVYGNSIVKLRFYGPWGEERTSEKYVSVPFNFIPLHQFEYNVTAGIVEDRQKSRYSRAAFNYGLSRRMTVGGGMEYLSSVTSGTSLPFINASLRVGSSMLVSGEHTHSVKSKIMLNYRLPSNLQFDLAYTGYDKDQTAILFNYSSEKRMMLSMPLRARKFTAFSRLTVNQFTLPPKPGVKTKEKFTSSEFLVSAVVSGVSSNLTTFAVFDRPGNPLVYSNLSLNFRLPRGIRFRPQAQFEYGHGNFSFIKGEVEKSIFKRGFMNIAYEKALVPDNMSSVTVGFRYNFSFAQTFFSAGKIDHAVATTQSARGSLMYDAKASYLGFKNQSSVGTGGLIILAYLDLNCNGRRDRGEPKAHGLKLHINGGRTELSTGDTTIRITALETSTSYYVEIDKNSFNNIAWQIRNATLKIAVNPNQFRLIEVPVAVMGEVSGKVMFTESTGPNGIGRIIINIYNKDLNLVSRMLTEADGYFSFMGLPPGVYTATADPAQLAKLKMTSSPAVSFTIAQNEEGDVVSDLEFILRKNLEESPSAPDKK